MGRNLVVCLVALVLLPSAAAATGPQSDGRRAVLPYLPGVAPGGGAIASFAPLRTVRAFANPTPSAVARCGGELAFSPDATCTRACDASKDACDSKCSMGLNSCLAQCPVLGFACDAYCRAAVIVCRGSCARAHGACVDRCPQRGARESKRIVTNGILGQ